MRDGEEVLYPFPAPYDPHLDRRTFQAAAGVRDPRWLVSAQQRRNVKCWFDSKPICVGRQGQGEGEGNGS